MMKLLGRGLKILLGNWVTRLRMILYVFFGIMAALGAWMLFTGAPEGGMFLIALNALFLFLLVRHDKKTLAKQDREIEEEIRKNREEKI